MLYEEATHPRISVGQLWRCASHDGETALIVAIDSCPGGLVVNVILEDGSETNGVRQLLAPIEWQHLDAHLGEVIGEHVDISTHLDSYLEWKESAQLGQAGYWTCAPGQIFATVRKGTGG